MNRKAFICACSCFGGILWFSFGKDFAVTTLCVAGLALLYTAVEG